MIEATHRTWVMPSGQLALSLRRTGAQAASQSLAAAAAAEVPRPV